MENKPESELQPRLKKLYEYPERIPSSAVKQTVEILDESPYYRSVAGLRAPAGDRIGRQSIPVVKLDAALGHDTLTRENKGLDLYLEHGIHLKFGKSDNKLHRIMAVRPENEDELVALGMPRTERVIEMIQSMFAPEDISDSLEIEITSLNNPRE